MDESGTPASCFPRSRSHGAETKACLGGHVPRVSAEYEIMSLSVSFSPGGVV